MFENLSDRLQDVVHKIKGYGKITEENISEMMRENEWGVARKMYSKEAVLSYIESITVRPNKALVVKYKSFEQINRLVRKHRHY